MMEKSKKHIKNIIYTILLCLGLIGFSSSYTYADETPEKDYGGPYTTPYEIDEYSRAKSIVKVEGSLESTDDVNICNDPDATCCELEEDTVSLEAMCIGYGGANGGWDVSDKEGECFKSFKACYGSGTPAQQCYIVTPEGSRQATALDGPPCDGGTTASDDTSPPGGTGGGDTIETDSPRPEEETAPPSTSCFFHASGVSITSESGRSEVGVASVIGQEDTYSEIVGPGRYPDAKVPFDRSHKQTFDAVAIGPNARVKLYSGTNFTGSVIANLKGPIAVVNSALGPQYKEALFKVWPEPFETNIPKSTRYESPNVPASHRGSAYTQDTRRWSTGSVEVTCE